MSDRYVEIAALPDHPAIREEVQRRVRELAQSDPDPGIRKWAVGDVNFAMPAEFLKQVAANDPDANVRKRAKERLVQFMGPRWDAEDAAELARMAKSADVETRQLAVTRISDPMLLARLAEKDPDRQVREDAVDRLAEHADVSQAVLARIAERDRDERVRSSAAALVTDPKVLERLLRTSRVDSVRRHALENLEGQRVDEGLLLWVVEHDGDDELRQEAVRRLEDQGALGRLARTSASVSVRTVATAKLKDQKLLGEIAMRDSAGMVYRAAITTITDQEVLADVVRRRPDEDVLQVVAQKATDQRVLLVIAKTAQEWLTRAGAVGRLTDVKALEEIAASDSVPMVCEAARKRLAGLQP